MQGRMLFYLCFLWYIAAPTQVSFDITLAVPLVPKCEEDEAPPGHNIVVTEEDIREHLDRHGSLNATVNMWATAL